MSKIACGFTYLVEAFERERKIAEFRAHNLVPIEGLNYLINAGLRNQSAFANIYMGLYEGDYTPDPDDTAATFPGSATELTTYVESTRRAVVLGVPASGASDNSAARCEFTGNTNGRQAMGGFITSAATKGATSGVLLSAVRFPSPAPFNAGTVFRVTGTFNFVSL